MPFTIPEANEYKIPDVEAHAEQRIHGLGVLQAHVDESALYLLNNFSGPQRVKRGAYPCALASGILVLDQDTVIDAIHETASYGEFVPSFEFDTSGLLDRPKFTFRGNTNLFFLRGSLGSRSEALRVDLCAARDQIIKPHLSYDRF